LPIATVALLMSGLVSAAVAGSTQAEIEHLKNYLASSGCTYVRNGREHDSAEAVEHIEKKARYFDDEIDSAESFIEFSATKSTMSGKPYTIRCPGEPEQASSAWLLEELQRYRRSAASEQ